MDTGTVANWLSREKYFDTYILFLDVNMLEVFLFVANLIVCLA